MGLIVQFPIGIDSDRFKRALELAAVKKHVQELTQRFAGRKVRRHTSLILIIICQKKETNLVLLFLEEKKSNSYLYK
jgi:hypothetical protein